MYDYCESLVYCFDSCKHCKMGCGGVWQGVAGWRDVAGCGGVWQGVAGWRGVA